MVAVNIKFSQPVKTGVKVIIGMTLAHFKLTPMVIVANASHYFSG
jgi:hypothetical protein